MEIIGLKTYLTQDQYKEIEKLCDCALQASNKKEANDYIKRILYIAPGLQGAAKNVLHDLIGSLQAASGCVSDRERKEYFCFMDLQKLQWFVRQEQANDWR